MHISNCSFFLPELPNCSTHISAFRGREGAPRAEDNRRDSWHVEHCKRNETERTGGEHPAALHLHGSVYLNIFSKYTVNLKTKERGSHVYVAFVLPTLIHLKWNLGLDKLF